RGARAARNLAGPPRRRARHGLRRRGPPLSRLDPDAAAERVVQRYRPGRAGRRSRPGRLSASARGRHPRHRARHRPGTAHRGLSAQLATGAGRGSPPPAPPVARRLRSIALLRPQSPPAAAGTRLVPRSFWWLAAALVGLPAAWPLLATPGIPAS